MVFSIPSNGLPFTLIIGVKTTSPEDISIIAKDFQTNHEDKLKEFIKGIK